MSKPYEIGDAVECSEPDVSTWLPGVIERLRGEMVSIRLLNGRLVAYDLYYAGELVRPRTIVDHIADLGRTEVPNVDGG